ncbi:MAG TPA: DUF1841 family protein [Chromatiales bacterium]|jgi:alpha-D-ribose 1-methylphosphonate 5-triphosphate diphosphatase PhnM|nr:DUF1841 family protein [Chromatiales bacterium]HIO53726.1 DUF1841 family protein [Chromatiales bacterium]
MFGQDRNQLRKFFFQVWKKRAAGKILEPLEALVADVIDLHPEYHALLADLESNLDRDYTPEMGNTNPFLHMAMHISIREQVSTNQPSGISDIYNALAKRYNDRHDFEHKMMECLGTALWEAQKQNRLPDDHDYLECLRKL